MPKPRFSIAGIMVATLLVAANLAACRAIFRYGEASRAAARPAALHPAEENRLQCLALIVIGVLPMASILGFLGLGMLRNVIRGGSSSFLVGFQVVGWMGLVLLLAASTFDIAWTRDYIQFAGDIVFPPIVKLFGPLLNTIPSWLGVVIDFGFITLFFLLPEMLLALVGGMLAAKARVHLALAPRPLNMAAEFEPAAAGA